MNQYENLKHMSKITRNDIEMEDSSFYLPHHPVLRHESLTTKLRVVFDGSHKTSNGNSLNEELLVGPAVQETLFTIILRFRTLHYVITGDIVMMYRQVLVAEEDRKLQRIFWREDPEEELEIYELNTVTYGTSAGLYLATRSIKQLAIADGNQYPLAKEAALEDFYMDDVLTGADTKEEAIELQKQLQEFELRKWRANDKSILHHLVCTGILQHIR